MEKHKNWDVTVEQGDKELKLARIEKFRKVLDALEKGEKGHQNVSITQLDKLRETHPCGAIYIALGRTILSNGVSKAFKVRK